MSLDCPDLSLRLPTPEEYQRLLNVLDVNDSEVLWAVRVGSHVYGTAQAHSDEDFMVALTGNVKEDLLIRDRVNVTIRSKAGFQASLDNQNVFALECLLAPMEHTFKRMPQEFKWKYSWEGLRHEAFEKSQSDYTKAVRGPTMDYKAKKRLWHSLRVPNFAVQMWRNGYIRDWGGANEMYWDIMTDPSEDAAHYAEVWGPARLIMIDPLVHF